MTLLKSLTIAIVASAFVPATHAADLPPAKLKIADWPRMSVADFGCVLEKTLGYRDARFNCSLTNYTNDSGPCNETNAYYEGPKFPKELAAAAIHPFARLVSVDYEHGLVRSVSIHLDGKFSREEILKAFSIQPMPLSDNIMEVTLGDYCGPDVTCVLITGFDHMGAGDVNCSAVPKTPKP
jgi:hypothetical protein